jgi:hypothetical protein
MTRGSLPPAEKARGEATQDMGAIHTYVCERGRVPYGEARARCRDGRKPQTINSYFRQLLDKKRIVMTINKATTEIEVWDPKAWDEFIERGTETGLIRIRDGASLGPALLALEREGVKRWQRAFNFDVEWS